MSDESPYLFDVSALVLALADTPVQERPLSYVRQAIAGDIDAIVPYAALVGAQHILTGVYGYTNAEACNLVNDLMDASRIHWYDRIGADTVREGFHLAGSVMNANGWDGYYAQVAIEEGANTILTTDSDFERVEGVTTKYVLTKAEFDTLNDFLNTR